MFFMQVFFGVALGLASIGSIVWAVMSARTQNRASQLGCHESK